jgi:hypothetical protein
LVISDATEWMQILMTEEVSPPHAPFICKAIVYILFYFSSSASHLLSVLISHSFPYFCLAYQRKLAVYSFHRLLSQFTFRSLLPPCFNVSYSSAP